MRANLYVSEISSVRDFGQFYISIANVSGCNGSSDRQAKDRVINYDHFHVRGKNVDTHWFINKKVYAVKVCPLKINTARAVLANAISFAMWRSWEQNFNPLNCFLSWTYGAGWRPHVWTLLQISSFLYSITIFFYSSARPNHFSV